MKKYVNPATEAVELNGERIMEGVNQSPAGGEGYAPARV